MADYTPAMLAQLEAQRAYLASDDHIRREVEVWADTTPEQRLAEMSEMCAAGDYFLAQLDPVSLERALQREPLPEDSVAIFVALRQQR